MSWKLKVVNIYVNKELWVKVRRNNFVELDR